MGRQIFAAEISHEDAPIACREKLIADEATVKQHLRHLGAVTDEVFLISSCNRFTIYIFNDTIAPLTDFFARYPALKGYVQYYYNSEESITHLFAVASGLLSPIKGDHVILEQLKQAHQWATECASIGVTLDNLLKEAMRIGKRVRTETGIDKFCSSVVDAGIELLYNRLDSLHDKKFLIIGTGKIARLALRYLYNEGIQKVRVVSKDLGRARHLAELYHVEAVRLEDLHVHVREADVIIGGTHYEVSLFPEDYIARFQDPRKMWFILDFGMPRNFNSKLAQYNCIELHNLDDLKRLHKSPLDAFGGVEAAWNMVMQEAKGFMEVLLQLELSPVLVAYWNRILYIQNRELSTLLPRLDDRLGDADIERIRLHAKRLIKNMTSSSDDNIRLISNNTRAENARDWLTRIESFDRLKYTISLN